MSGILHPQLSHLLHFPTTICTKPSFKWFTQPLELLHMPHQEDTAVCSVPIRGPIKLLPLDFQPLHHRRPWMVYLFQVMYKHLLLIT
ncbi:hypothetical protein Hanom_Chr11g01012951 [Helianthus anomalus]